MADNEKTPPHTLDLASETHTRLPPAHAHARGAQDARTSSTKRPVATHSSVTQPDPLPRRAVRSVPLKRTEAFRAVYRRGRWVRGALLSVGVLPNHQQAARTGLRTRRGLKGAVVRNRLKRQLRTALSSEAISLRVGLDVVVVIHPPALPITTAELQRELWQLCRRLDALS